jgi:hypothetical protein
LPPFTHGGVRRLERDARHDAAQQACARWPGLTFDAGYRGRWRNDRKRDRRRTEDRRTPGGPAHAAGSHAP